MTTEITTANNPDFVALCARLNLPADTAYDPHWSAAPDFLERLVHETAQRRPEIIVECSSGSSTVLLARACQRNGCGHVYSLENGAEFAERTRAALARHGLATWATVLDAPLCPLSLDGEAPHDDWYDWQILPVLLDDRPIELLAIDGPPGFLQRHSRYPALPCLAPFLAPGARILLDDAARPDEREIVERWLARWPDMKAAYLDFERGCAVLDWPGLLPSPTGGGAGGEGADFAY